MTESETEHFKLQLLGITKSLNFLDGSTLSCMQSRQMLLRHQLCVFNAVPDLLLSSLPLQISLSPFLHPLFLSPVLLPSLCHVSSRQGFTGQLKLALVWLDTSGYPGIHYITSQTGLEYGKREADISTLNFCAIFLIRPAPSAPFCSYINYMI